MMAGYAMAGQRPGGPGGPGGAGGLADGAGGRPPFGFNPGGPGGAASAAEADYSTPVKGAESFLAAVQSKDVERISDAVAARAIEEASARTKSLFRAIKESTVEPDQLDELARIFDGMKVLNTNRVRSTNVRGIIVGRTEEGGDQIMRTLELRKEKEGWRVRDFSGERVIDVPSTRAGSRTNQGGGYGPR
jgi:hypothetical protein